MRGGKLSGGQKQRVAIARTVVRNPSVYMFDEATSALDTQSEKTVQEAINNITQHNTSLSIAHRISTIRDSDVIFVIDHGKIVEKGTYDQLMTRQGIFYQLNKMASAPLVGCTPASQNPCPRVESRPKSAHSTNPVPAPDAVRRQLHVRPLLVRSPLAHSSPTSLLLVFTQ